MSLLFLETDVMTVEVHDREGNKPSEGNRLRPSVLLPGTIAGAMSSKSKDDTTKDDDSSESSTSSTPKWKKRRTRNDVVALQYREKLKKMEAVRLNRQTTFSEGGLVSTIHPQIAPQENFIRPGKKYRKRIPTFGKIIKQSEFFPNFWLVDFYSLGKSFYVTEKVVNFLSKAGPDVVFKRGPTKSVVMKNINKNVQQNKEIIMTDILCSKVQKIPDLNLCTYQNVCDVFKPHYFWLSPNMLKNHAFVLRETLEKIQKGTWLYELPDPFPEMSKDANSKTKLETKSHNSVTPSK